MNEKIVSEEASLLTLPVWPGIAPDAPADPPTEIVISDKEKLVAGSPVVCLGNVFKPTLTFYPAKGENSGAAVLVFPGGGVERQVRSAQTDAIHSSMKPALQGFTGLKHGELDA